MQCHRGCWQSEINTLSASFGNKAWLYLFTLISCWSLVGHAAQGPSFSCAKPSLVEAAICADPSLAARDRVMAMLFDAAKVSALGIGPSNERAVQRAWLKRRGTLCGGETLPKCISDDYDDRLFDLAIADLFSSQEAALRELRHQNEKAAAFYQTIADYVTLPNGSTRVAKLTAEIKPIFDVLSRSAPGSGPGSIAATPEEVISSDKSFSDFIAAASAESILNRFAPLALPCGALVRRPGLLAALGSRYGGVVDGMLPKTDCADTMPPTPALTQLISAAAPDPADCTGTVRVSTTKEFDKLVQAVRLHIPALWHLPGKTEMANQKDSEAAQLKTLINKQWISAVNELAAYYVEYFHSSNAKSEASEAVEAVATRQKFGVCL